MELVTGCHACTPRAHSKQAAVSAHLPQGQAVGRGRLPNPKHTWRRQEAPLPGALVMPPQFGQAARKSVRCEVGNRSPHPHPLCPQ